MMGSSQLRVALGQYDIGWHDPDASLDRAAQVVARSAAAGARLVVLPEMCTSVVTREGVNVAESPTSAGPGRAHPNDEWSRASATTGAAHDSPPFTDRATTSAALLSARGCHHAAYQSPPPNDANAREPGHAPGGATNDTVGRATIRGDPAASSARCQPGDGAPAVRTGACQATGGRSQPSANAEMARSATPRAAAPPTPRRTIHPARAVCTGAMYNARAAHTASTAGTRGRTPNRNTG